MKIIIRREDLTAAAHSTSGRRTAHGPAHTAASTAAHAAACTATATHAAAASAATHVAASTATHVATAAATTLSKRRRGAKRQRARQSDGRHK